MRKNSRHRSLPPTKLRPCTFLQVKPQLRFHRLPPNMAAHAIVAGVRRKTRSVGETGDLIVSDIHLALLATLQLVLSQT